jgi:hypothetical protein
MHLRMRVTAFVLLRNGDSAGGFGSVVLTVVG